MRPILIVLILAAAGLIGFLVWQQSRVPPLVVSGFVEADEIRVGSRVGGRVAEVKAIEGQSVAPGESLYTIDPFDLRERLAEAQSAREAAQAEHERLKKGFRPEEIEQARAKRDQWAAELSKLEAGPRKQDIEAAREQVNIARASFDFAEKEHVRLTRLVEQQQVAAPREYDEAVRMLKAAQGELAAAQQQLSLLEEGSRKEDIARTKAALAEAAEQLKLLEAGSRAEDVAQAAAQEEAAAARVHAIEKQLAELVVSSPCQCVVEAFDLQPGELVSPNQPSIALLDLSKLWVRAYVPEGRLGEIALGDRVPVRVTSPGGGDVMGRVVFISREGEFTPRNVQTPEERSKQAFRIKVAIEKGGEHLRVGMSADVLLAEAARP
ncbi:Multidrug export protein EmrA [Phycisphaerae bacterium RAS2]|nr:Multidrug export protein EmrA [Phycisphaerae bacterium RAS2]